MHVATRSFAVMLLASVAACDACQPAPLALRDDCSLLLFDVDCGLPFPSDAFVVVDASMPSGHRVQLPEAARMVTTGGASADLYDSWQADGASTVTPMVFSFGERVLASSVPGIFDDPAHTLMPGFATALIDAVTGERVMHFIDVDARADTDSREALIMRTLDALKPEHRYIVAISGVQAKDGALRIPAAFLRLRDDDTARDPKLATLAAHYQRDIFARIEAAGIKRGALQLAWDFTTASTARATSDLLSVRALALEWLDTHAPTVTVDTVFEGATLASVLDDDSGQTWRYVKGTITGPLMLAQDASGALLARGPQGDVVQNGTLTFPFVAAIPTAVLRASTPAQVVAFGHGFFGSRSELEESQIRAIGTHAQAVMIAIDWQGMSEADIGSVVTSVGGEVSRSVEFGDRVMQAMSNWLVVTKAVTSGVFAQQSAFLRPDGSATIDAATSVAFVGISMGHILGGTLAALDPNIDRVVLQVGGAGFCTLMFRARPFERFLALLNLSLPDALDQQKLSAMMQTQLDRIDPATYAPYVLGGELPAGPANNFAQRRVLMQMGIGDAQVPNLGTQLHARLLKLPLLTPHAASVVDVLTADLPTQPFPVSGSGLSVFSLGVDPEFYRRAQPADDDNVVHDGLRKQAEVLQQQATFIRTGVILNPCEGECLLAP